MRSLPILVAACVTLCAGATLAQEFSSPSLLSPPRHLYRVTPVTRHLREAAEPLPLPGDFGQSIMEDGRNAGRSNAISPLPYDVPCDHCGVGGPCSTPEFDPWSSGCHGCCDCCNWFGSISGLIMSRDGNDPVWTSFRATVDNAALLGTPNVDPTDWKGGFEATFGRRLDCNCQVEATYWTLDADNNSLTVVDATNRVDSALDFNRLDFYIGGIANGVNGFFDGAQAHRLSMRNEIHNLEVNFRGAAPTCWYPCQTLRLSWLAGFRYFRFSEGFEFASSTNAPGFGIDPSNEAYYNVDVDNNLVGFQIGCRGECRAACRLTLFAESRFGVYYNYITHDTTLNTGEGIYAVDQFGKSWNINTDKHDFSTLAQLDLGGRYRFAGNWSVFLSYRLIAASGVALSTTQIPQFISDYNGIQNINSSGHLFLHGAVGGVSCQY